MKDTRGVTGLWRHLMSEMSREQGTCDEQQLSVCTLADLDRSCSVDW